MRVVTLRNALHDICTTAERALLQRVWRLWCEAAVGRIRGERRARLRQMTPYQMLFGKSTAVEAAHINVQRKRHLLKSITKHGNIVKRNILAVVLSETPESHTYNNNKNNNSWDMLALPDNNSPEATPMNYRPRR
ncbi:hypothetical protein LSM04_009704 [Trypanosoma melophagium]|uniref:uncharacterized protein n=1 Tax=Trypanosoma melophagium TaxID=715481 RepID=UPI00351A4D76|nr:hypothetical protein LSM04_009704 [Trypanosoma melophagium]